MRLTALRAFKYRGRLHQPGDMLAAPRGHARVHMALKNATAAPPDPALLAEREAYEEAMRAALRKLTNPKLRDLAAEEGVNVEGDDNKADLVAKITAARGRYRTRRLTAED